MRKTAEAARAAKVDFKKLVNKSQPGMFLNCSDEHVTETYTLEGVWRQTADYVSLEDWTRGLQKDMWMYTKKRHVS